MNRTLCVLISDIEPSFFDFHKVSDIEFLRIYTEYFDLSILFFYKISVVHYSSLDHGFLFRRCKDTEYRAYTIMYKISKIECSL